MGIQIQQRGQFPAIVTWALGVFLVFPCFIVGFLLFFLVFCCVFSAFTAAVSVVFAAAAPLPQAITEGKG